MVFNLISHPTLKPMMLFAEKSTTFSHSSQQNLHQHVSLQFINEPTPVFCSAIVDYPTRSFKPYSKILTIYKARIHSRICVFQGHSRKALQPACFELVCFIKYQLESDKKKKKKSKRLSPQYHLLSELVSLSNRIIIMNST